MKTFLAAFGLSAVVSILLTPLIRTIVPKLGAVDLPSGRRVHKKTIPRKGGIAIIAGLFVPLLEERGKVLRSAQELLLS